MRRILIALVVVVGLGSNAWGMSLFDQSKKIEALEAEIADMKIKINWKQFAAFFIVIGCTYYITRNFFMTAGILMLLLLIDGLLLDYDHRRRGRKQAEEIMKGLKDEETDEDKQ